MIDLVGKKFGKLTVVCRHHLDKWRTIHWECICDCGNTTISSSRVLRAGKKKSCGCLYNRPLEDRLLERSKCVGDCWIWLGSTTPDGYGTISAAKNKRHFTHKLSYQLFIGDVPNGICVCHECDTPQCVNPSHLFLGTHSENMADMRRKGRAGKPRKLYDQDMPIILKMLDSGLSQRAIANIYGVSISTILRSKKRLK